MRSPLAVAALAVLATLGLAGCGGSTSEVAPTPSAPTTAAVVGDPCLTNYLAPGCAGEAAARVAERQGPPCVTYVVTGATRSARITYATPSGQQQDTISVPLTTTDGKKGARYCDFERGDFLYISAQNDQGYGDVTCKIKVGSAVISENTSSGGYSIATCQGSLP